MTYGCFDRKPLKTAVVVQDGWFMDGVTRTPRMIQIPDPMTKDCHYSKDDKYLDPGCIGCTHRETKQK